LGAEVARKPEYDRIALDLFCWILNFSEPSANDEQSLDAA
jgi:hypothetical protein